MKSLKNVIVNNVLRLAIAYVRSVVILSGLLYIVGGIFTLVKDKDPGSNLIAFETIITCLILIFPIAILKTNKQRKIYLRFLIPTTILRIIVLYLTVPFSQSIMDRANPDIYYTFIFVLNLIIIVSFFKHLLNDHHWNPFYSGKIRLLNNFLILTFILLQIILPFIPPIFIHNTPDGMRYFDHDSIWPQIRMIFTDKAINSNYELASFSYANNQTCFNISQKKPIDKTMSIIMNKKKMLTIDYDQNPMAFTINPENNSEKTVLEMDMYGHSYIYGNNGDLVELDAKNYLKNPHEEVHIARFKPGYIGSWDDNKSFNSGDGIIITICKDIQSLGVASKDIHLENSSSIKTTSIPWNVSLVDNSQEIKIIKEVRMKYYSE